MSLPSGYTLLEYIESTGTQYIDTGVTLSGTAIKMIVDFQFTTYVNNSFLTRAYGSGGTFGAGLYSNSFYTEGFTASQTLKSKRHRTWRLLQR